MDHVIEAHGLRKTFGETVAVDGISLQVRRGECFGILGPNGAGKTTTIHMLYGFSPPAGGSLKIFGLDIRDELRAIKARIGVCPQANNLDPDLTVRQNLEVYAGYFDLPRRQARQRVATLIDFFALTHRGDSSVATLSGGMMRRLVLARALLNEPQLLILDEPTTGLDPQSRHQIWQRLEELKRRGLTILLTTHYMEEAAQLCDRLVIMDGGRILVEDHPRVLIHRHVGREVIEINEPGAEVRAFLREHHLAHEDLGYRLLIYSSDGEDLYRRLLETYCQVGCMLRPATLEDVFLRLTGRELRE